MNSATVKMKSSYRPEIDGLRAFAVLSVIIFHLNEYFLPGGFVGVDVFFVISGFLISNHLFADVNSGQFSFGRFYLKRARRILPALYVLIIFTMILSTLLLLPADNKRAAKIATEALMYKANYYFARYADYFSHNTMEFSFLHLWSLSVEEQFYFLLPAILFGVFKMSSYLNISFKKTLLWVLGGIFLGSLFWSEFSLSHDSLKKLAFYDALSRACEFLVGALLAVFDLKINQKMLAEILSLVGFAMLSCSLFLLNSKTRFPGVHSLLPCFGAALVIASNEKTLTWVGHFFSLKPIVFVGAISYSLYLYHWPLLALFRYSNIQIFFTNVQMITLFVTAVVLAVFNWRFVELPFRKPTSDSTSRALLKIFVTGQRKGII